MQSTRIITEVKPEGMPMGVYDVMYYRVHGARVVPLKTFDRDVSDNYLPRVESDEIAVMTCKSQRGGCTIYGSPAAKEAWLRELKEEAARQEQARKRSRVGEHVGWRWELTALPGPYGDVIRFVASEGSGEPVQHSITRADLARFAADPTQAGDWERLPWAAVQETLRNASR